MVGREFEDLWYDLKKFGKYTQPAGPLCLWQCFQKRVGCWCDMMWLKLRTCRNSRCREKEPSFLFLQKIFKLFVWELSGFFSFYRQGLKISNFAGIISSQWENAPPDQEMTLDSETKRQNKFSRQAAFDWLTWSLISGQNTSFESFRCVYRNATQNMRK